MRWLENRCIGVYSEVEMFEHVWLLHGELDDKDINVAYNGEAK
jgi:hypothetical protein